MNTTRKGSKHNIIDKYYESLARGEGSAKKPGQLYYTHVVYPHDYPRILKQIQYDPKNESKSTFTMKYYSDGDEKHYPVKELKLRDGELYYILKGKKRLVIVVGYIECHWIKKDEPQEVLICAPVFSFKPYHSQEMVIKAQAFDYPNLFYLPPNPYGCYNESAVRYEMIQPIMSGYLQPFYDRLNNNPAILTTEAYRLLLVHLVRFLSNEIIDSKLNDDIIAWHDLLIEDWQKTCQVS
ncbi:MAG: hypothetical protein WBB37_01490 [bacterium]